MLVWRRQHAHACKLDIALLDGVEIYFLVFILVGWKAPPTVLVHFIIALCSELRMGIEGIWEI